MNYFRKLMKLSSVNILQNFNLYDEYKMSKNSKVRNLKIQKFD